METASSLMQAEKIPLTHGQWAPLVYPASALRATIDHDSETNLCFPLDEHVLEATVRELLILDKSVDPETLALTLETSKYRGGVVGPAYLRHSACRSNQVRNPPN